MKNIQNITLELNKRTYQSITANTGEVGSRFIKINIIDNGIPIDLTGISVFIYAKKPDGTKIFNTVEVEDSKNGIVLVELTSQVLVIEGIVKLTLLLTKENKKLTSKVFELKVDASIVDDEAIESSNEFGALTGALVKVDEWNGYFEETSGKIEEKYTDRLNKVDSQIKDIQSEKLDKNGILSMANMGQDVKEAMTGGSVAVVGNNTVLANNIVDGQVKLVKIDNHLRDCFTENMGEYIDYYAEIENGWLHYNSNVIQNDAKRKVYTFNVSHGDKVQVTGYVLGNSALVKGFDVEGNKIFSFPDSNTPVATLYENYEFIVPNDVVKIKYCNFYSPYVGSLNYSTEDSFKVVMDVKLKTDKLDKDITKVSNEENELLKEKIKELQKMNDFAWGDFDKTYITFTFDDSNKDISDIQHLFESKNVPVCFATIPSKLNNICNDGSKVVDVLKRCEENGGEVLSHWHTPLTSSSTDEDYKMVYIKTKQMLEEQGFNVNGIITTGGTNYNTQDFSKCVDIARICYDYADRTAESSDLQHIEQFWNPRTFMDGSESKCKAKIDEAVLLGNVWIRFASHGAVNNDTIELIGNIIDYAKSKGCEIVTWKYMYDNFKSSKLEKRLIALENK